MQATQERQRTRLAFGVAFHPPRTARRAASETIGADGRADLRRDWVKMQQCLPQSAVEAFVAQQHFRPWPERAHQATMLAAHAAHFEQTAKSEAKESARCRLTPSPVVDGDVDKPKRQEEDRSRMIVSFGGTSFGRNRCPDLSVGEQRTSHVDIRAQQQRLHAVDESANRDGARSCTVDAAGPPRLRLCRCASKTAKVSPC